MGDNQQKTCAASLAKCIATMRKTKLDKADGVPPPPPPPPPMLNPAATAAFTAGFLGKADGAKVNPALLSKEPTHSHNGIPMKSLHKINTKRGEFHTLEIMDGEHKGKWTNAYGHELEPLQKGSKWKPYMDGNE